MNLLIVDDDLALAAMLALHFEDCGFEVSQAHNCREARALISKHTFDLALVDYQLPDGTGLELLGILRKTTPHLKIIIMSGVDDPGLKNRLDINGLRYFISKPIESTKLDSMVHKALGMRAKLS